MNHSHREAPISFSRGLHSSPFTAVSFHDDSLCLGRLKQAAKLVQQHSNQECDQNMNYFDKESVLCDRPTYFMGKRVHRDHQTRRPHCMTRDAGHLESVLPIPELKDGKNGKVGGQDQSLL
jgi:hypothetical protein